MESGFNEVNSKLVRVECDRILRSYRTMNDVLLSARSYGRIFGDEDTFDEVTVRAQMYAIRSAILEVEDSRERLFLYHYYIKGNTIENCAKILGISRRSVFRTKSKAIDNIAKKLSQLK